MQVLKTTKILLTLVLLLMVVNANAFTGYSGYSKLPEPQPTSKGELIYQEMGCVMCHGIQGDGDGFLASGLKPRPRDFTDYKVMARVPDQSISDAIENGIMGSAMPSFNLSDDQIADVTAYVRSFSADSHITVNICMLDNETVKTGVDMVGIRVAVENPSLIDVEKNGSTIIISPNAKNVYRKTKSSKSNTTRTLIRLVKDDEDGERNVSVIAVRLHSCMHHSGVK